MWDWGGEQQASFDHIKNAITRNTTAGVDYQCQFHLVVDMSPTGIGGVLFQLVNVPPNMEALLKHWDQEQIVMFMSFHLNDAETCYSNPECECLGVVKCLAEVRWMITGSCWLVIIYTNHHALTSILHKGSNNQCMQLWENWLGEYDYMVWHQPNTDSLMCIMDGLSRMPTQYQT